MRFGILVICLFIGKIGFAQNQAFSGSFTLSNSTSVTATSCYGKNDGIISVNGSQFAQPATAIISGIFPQNYFGSYPYTLNQNQLKAGTYTVTITDANNIIHTQVYTVNQGPKNFFPSLTVKHANCSGQNGSILAATGVPTYLYALENLSSGNPPTIFEPTNTNNSFQSLNHGTYMLTIKNSNGCIYDSLISILDSSVYNPNYTIISPNTCVNNSATIATEAFNAINNTIAYDTFTLLAGTHIVNIQNSIGCSVPLTINIPNSYWQATATYNPITCAGGTTTVNVSPSAGGVFFGPFTGTGNYAVTAGTYSYVLTDVNGCKDTAYVSITQPPAINITLSTTPILCNGGSSTLNFNVNNAQGSYSSSLQNNSALAAGVYTLSIIDAANCMSTKSFAITQPAPLTTIMNYAPIVCHGDSTQVTYNTIGGTPPYAQSIPTVTPWPAGSYTVFTNDANNCYATNSIVITQPSVLNINYSLTQTDTGVIINAAPQGGIPGYQSTLYFKNGNTYDSITNMLPYLADTSGQYKIVIVDQIGCSKEVEFIVNNIASINSKMKRISIYPNPARDILYIHNPRNEKIVIYDCTGRIILESYSSAIDIRSLLNGIYTINLGNHFARLAIEH